ncbi:uncharacterized protein LOC144371082 [Ictidomys tridecemlineatus]
MTDSKGLGNRLLRDADSAGDDWTLAPAASQGSDLTVWGSRTRHSSSTTSSTRVPTGRIKCSHRSLRRQGASAGAPNHGLGRRAPFGWRTRCRTPPPRSRVPLGPAAAATPFAPPLVAGFHPLHARSTPGARGGASSEPRRPQAPDGSATLAFPPGPGAGSESGAQTSRCGEGGASPPGLSPLIGRSDLTRWPFLPPGWGLLSPLIGRSDLTRSRFLPPGWGLLSPLIGRSDLTRSRFLPPGWGLPARREGGICVSSHKSPLSRVARDGAREEKLDRPQWPWQAGELEEPAAAWTKMLKPQNKRVLATDM